MTQIDAGAHTQPIRPRIGVRPGRRTLILAALALVTAGMATNWGWLVAVGAAPLILSLAPCIAMCGLGLCMMSGSKSCSSKTGAAETLRSTTD
ncbi:MAG: hypothetical protein ABGX10_06400 [Paracoccus sp. (in: a-proteobacteria)]|uniref:hypothetical protein n=1 Tax=Paracoccus sp. TaxID=267 RepID=UPI003241BAE6